MKPTFATPGLSAGRLRRSGLARRVLIGAGIAILVVLLWRSCAEEHLPNFAKYQDVDAKKTAFFEYLLPNVQSVNAAVLKDRKRLLHIHEELAEDGVAGFFDERWLRRLAEDYDLEPPEELDADFASRLLRRVDIIPPSLVLAQAANESAWGTSRFARRGNNLFGMRSYDGTGIIPKKRAAGKKFRVASYDSVRESIAAYVHNLNTHSRYRSMRQIRAGQRRSNEELSGHALANGLLAYSTRGAEYVSIIQSMIRSNDLDRYDQ